MAYDSSYVASSTDDNFNILDKAYAGTATAYAKFKMAIDSNNCREEGCEYETKQLKQLKDSPKQSLSFIELVVDQLKTTEDFHLNLTVNWNYTYLNNKVKEH